MSSKLFLLIGLFLASCSNKTEVGILMEYANSLNYFSSDLVSHFPRRLTDTNIVAIDVTPPAGAYAKKMSKLFLTVKMDIAGLKSLHTDLQEEGIRCYTVNDPIFIIIGDTIDYSSKENGIPVPNFIGIRRKFGLKRTTLSDDYSICIIESKSGQYLDQKYLTNNVLLPQEWKNGFSRGIAISEKQNQAIYWMAVW